MATTDPQPPTDYKIVKTEVFDPDMLHVVSNHEGIPGSIKRTLKAYRKKAVNGNEVPVIYEFGKEWASLQKGRISPQKGLGLSCFRGDVRRALAAKYYWDLDMANAQPSILVALCKQKGWQCEKLQEYTLNRAAKLQEIMDDLNCDRDDAKDFCLAILFGAKIYNLTPYFQALSDELHAIADNCAAAFPAFLAVSKRQKKPNPKASCLAVVAQDLERELLLKIDDYLRTRGRSFDTLIYDGGLIRKLDGETEFPPDLIQDVEQHIAKTTGYPIKLAIKPMTHTFSIPEEKLVPTSITISDSWAAKKFVELLGPNIVLDSSRGRYIFDDTTGLWSQTEDTLKRWLNRFEKKMIFKQETAMGLRTYDYHGNESSVVAMIKNINRHLEPTDFVSPRSATAIGKLLFADGIFDMATGNFTEGFNPDYFFFGRIPRDFPRERDEEMIRMVHKLLFEDPYLAEQKEQARFYKIGLARALYGDYQAKRCYATVGEPNCGRGLLTGALAAAFGDYVDTFDSNNLLYNPRDGADSAKQNAWLLPIASARLAIGNEIRLTKDQFIDGNKLKAIASGGDTLKGRLNHKDAVSFVCMVTFLLQLNDLPTIKPADKGILNRLCVNELRKSYHVNPEPGNPRQMPQDSTLKAKFETEPYMNALFYVMMDAWAEFEEMGKVFEKPHDVVEATSDWVETKASIRALLDEEYEVTKNEEDFVIMKDILKYLNDKGCADSDTKIGRELSSWGCSSGQKKIGGVNRTIRTGIRRIPREGEEGL